MHNGYIFDWNGEGLGFLDSCIYKLLDCFGFDVINVVILLN